MAQIKHLRVEDFGTWDITSVNDVNLSQAIESLTESVDKLHAYVTPEMYGAVGDGISDDTQAVQLAFSNYDNLPVVMNGTYKTTSTLSISQNTKVINNGKILYAGSGYAVNLSGTIDGIVLNLGTVQSSGGCVLINDSDGFKQYIYIVAKTFNAGAGFNGLEIDAGNNSKWVNEVHVLGCHFSGGKAGAVLRNRSSISKSHFNFYGCGFEGVTNGVEFYGIIAHTAFFGCRGSESITQLFYTDSTLSDKALTVFWHGDMSLTFIRNFKSYVVYIYGNVLTTNGVRLSVPYAVFYNGRLYGTPYKKFKNLGRWSTDSEGVKTIEINCNGIDSANIYTLGLLAESVPTEGAKIVISKDLFTFLGGVSLTNELEIYGNFAPNSTLYIVDTSGTVLMTYSNTASTSIYTRTFKISYFSDYGYQFSPLVQNKYKGA